jgi:hypothetical protein
MATPSKGNVGGVHGRPERRPYQRGFALTVLAHELVHEDLAVVADDPPADAAVVKLVTDAPAAAREVIVVSRQAVRVLVLAALAVD